jgi:DNA repair exonuclease SbcCD ATPase subunit
MGQTQMNNDGARLAFATAVLAAATLAAAMASGLREPYASEATIDEILDDKLERDIAQSGKLASNAIAQVENARQSRRNQAGALENREELRDLASALHLKKVQADAERTGAGLARVQSDLTGYAQSSARLDGRVGKLQADFDKSAQDGVALAAINQSLGALGKTVASTSAGVTQVADKLTKVTAAVDTNASSLGSVRSEIDTIKSKVSRGAAV